MGCRYRLQRGGSSSYVGKKKKLFEIKTPNRHDIPIYKDISKLRKKYSSYKKKKNKRTRQQKGGFLQLAGLMTQMFGV